MHKIHISSSEESISVSHIDESEPGLSVASVDRVCTDEGSWYISRINVIKKQRGMGIGSKLLSALINEIKSRSDKGNIIVFPGGYNEDSDKQFSFYKRNGFIDGNKEGMLIYKITE